jgi:hypothetical protein
METTEKPEKTGELRPVGPGSPPVDTRFKPGNKASPGAPRGPRMWTRVKKFMKCKCPEEREAMVRKYFPDYKGKSISTEDALASVFTLKALSGEPWAMLEYIHREEGDVTQHHDHTTKGKEIKAAPQFVAANHETIELLKNVFGGEVPIVKDDPASEAKE